MFASRFWLGLLLLIVTAFPAYSAAAKDVEVEQGSAQINPKQDCMKQSDGTLDCSNLFIERGEDVYPVDSQTSSRCYGSGCNYANPYSSGCTVDYGVIDVVYIYGFNTSQQIGYVQLWWSNTCQVNWSRLVAYDWSRWGYTEARVFLDNNHDGNWLPNEQASYQQFTIYDGTRISAMLYAPSTPARATASLRLVPNGWGGDAWTSWW